MMEARFPGNNPERAIARAFVEARGAVRPLPRFPGEVPPDLDRAYAVQDQALILHGGSVGGWKVGRIGEPFAAQYGANRLAGPIFAESIVDGLVDPLPVMPVFADGFAAAEAELLVRIGPGIGAGMIPINLDEAREMIDQVRVGIEIASSPFPGINDRGPAATISDFGNNNGLVLGPELADWRERDLLNMPVRLLIDEREAGSATMASMLDGPFGSLRFLAANLAGRGISLPPGTWISTGAITGVHEVRPGQRVSALFGDGVRTECRIGAAKASAHIR